MVWDNPADLLDRKTEAENLTRLLIDYSDDRDTKSLTMNLSAEWGFGKTYFIDNWISDLLSKKHPSIKINTWTTDYTSDPLSLILNEINEQLQEHMHKSSGYLERLSSVKASSLKLLKTGAKPLAAIALKHLTRLSTEELWELLEQEDEQEPSKINDQVIDGMEAVSQEMVSTLLSGYIEQQAKQHRKLSTAISEFKDSLGTLTKFIDKKKAHKLPIFVFIDELDRCRPTHAIEVLELIKHIFGVPGVYFVIATDPQQLAESIRAVYGQGFNANIYLKRFFDFEYRLSKPSYEAFANFLTTSLTFNIPQHIYPIPYESNEQGVTDCVFRINEAFRLSLRDQQQCAVYAEMGLRGTQLKAILFFFYYFLVVLQYTKKDLFDQISENPGFLSSGECKKILSLEERKPFRFISYGYSVSGRGEDGNHDVLEIAAHYAACHVQPFEKLYRSDRHESLESYISCGVADSMQQYTHRTRAICDLDPYFRAVKHLGNFQR